MSRTFPRPWSRRAALLGAATLLAGCDTLDNLFGESKRPLPGERQAVRPADPPLTADGNAQAVALPPAEPVADWPMAGGPPGHSPGHVALPERMTIAWRGSAGSGSGYRQRITAGPVISGGTIYTVDARGRVVAHALADGRERWRADTTPENESATSLGGGAAVADGTVFVATGLAEVLALDAANGSVRWRTRLAAPARGSPTVAGGRVFVPTTQNELVAVSATDGRRLWGHRAGSLSTIPLGLPAPAVEGEAVVAGFGTGELVALRAADGRLLWAESVGSGNLSLADIVGIAGLPVIDRGRVLAVGVSSTAIAVDLRSGRRLWERSFGSGSGMAAAGDFAFAVTRDGDALAIGREDGLIRWVSPLDPPPEGGRRRAEPARFGQPLVGGGRIIVPSSRGELLLLDPANGSIAGRVPLGSGVTLPMAVAEGTLVALADDGTLIALR